MCVWIEKRQTITLNTIHEHGRTIGQWTFPWADIQFIYRFHIGYLNYLLDLIVLDSIYNENHHEVCVWIEKRQTITLNTIHQYGQMNSWQVFHWPDIWFIYRLFFFNFRKYLHLLWYLFTFFDIFNFIFF